MLHNYFVYIVTNNNHTVLYTGVTNNLTRRVFEHKNKLQKGFTAQYNANKLIYFERFDYIDLAIAREKQIKGYSRIKKTNLINLFNPAWQELYSNGKIVMPTDSNTPE